MPWCEPCAKYFTPNSVGDDGRCRQCGEPIQPSTGDAGPDPAAASTVAAGLDEEKAPWHFKLLVILTVLYLGWRVVDLVI